MKSVGGACALLAAATLASLPVAAGALDIDGTYGTPAGCLYVKTKNYGDDSAVVLTPDHFETFASDCEFLQALPVRDGSRVVMMLCSHEGESTRSVDFSRIVKSPDGADAYEVYGQAGELIERVGRCP